MLSEKDYTVSYYSGGGATSPVLVEQQEFYLCDPIKTFKLEQGKKLNWIHGNNIQNCDLTQLSNSVMFHTT